MNEIFSQSSKLNCSLIYSAFPRAQRRLDVLRLGHPPPVDRGRRQLHGHRQEQVRREEQPCQTLHERSESADKVRSCGIVCLPV